MITVETNAYAVAADLGEIPERMFNRVRGTLERIGSTLQRHVATEKITHGGLLEPRTGNLRRRLFYRVEGDGHDAKVIVGDAAAYARIQELGGTITPTHSQYLAIPIGQALTAKGVARFTARELIANPHAFGYAGTFVAKGIIFGKAADQIVPLFALKTSVTLPAREYLASTLIDKTPWIVEQFAQLAGEAIGGPSAG